MRLLMISGDRSLAQGKRGAFGEMLEEFAKHWERIDILTPQSRSGALLPSRHYPLPGNVFLHPSPYGLWYQPLWISKKGKELTTVHHHDIMTVHEYPPFYNGIGARWLQRHTDIRSALELHHIVGHPTPASCTEWIGRWISRLMLPSHARHFSRVRTVNRGVAELLVSWGFDRKHISLVPSFYVDHAIARTVAGQDKTCDLAFCGRLVENKGVEELIEAMKLLPDATLRIVGDGPLRGKLERMVVMRNLSSRVSFTGWLPESLHVAHTIAAARIFVVPSTSEGGPRVALEAMSYGVPVVATRVGILPDVIEDGVNSIFTTGSSADIAEKVGGLLRDEAVRQRIGEAAKKIMKLYERKEAIGAYARFLHEIAKN